MIEMVNFLEKDKDPSHNAAKTLSSNMPSNFFLLAVGGLFLGARMHATALPSTTSIGTKTKMVAFGA